MHNNPVINTITTIALELDEIPTAAPRAVVREGADPDGASAGAGSGGEIPLVLARRVLGEEASEERLEEGRTTTDETGVDLNNAAWGKHVISAGERKETVKRERKSEAKGGGIDSSREEKGLCVQPWRIGGVEIDDQKGKA